MTKIKSRAIYFGYQIFPAYGYDRWTKEEYTKVVHMEFVICETEFTYKGLLSNATECIKVFELRQMKSKTLFSTYDYNESSNQLIELTKTIEENFKNNKLPDEITLNFGDSPDKVFPDSLALQEYLHNTSSFIRHEAKIIDIPHELIGKKITSIIIDHPSYINILLENKYCFDAKLPNGVKFVTPDNKFLNHLDTYYYASIFQIQNAKIVSMNNYLDVGFAIRLSNDYYIILEEDENVKLTLPNYFQLENQHSSKDFGSEIQYWGTYP